MLESRLSRILSNFSKVKVAVAGDFFLDIYNYINPFLKERSLETEKEVYSVTKRECFPGGAGNVAKNIASLGGQVICLGIISRDGVGYDLKKSLKFSKGDISKFIYSNRFTPSYTKNLWENKEMSRYDLKNTSAINSTLQNTFLKNLEKIIPSVDACALIDQVSEKNFGVLPEKILGKLNNLAKENPTKIFIADSRTKIKSFKNMILKPNELEISEGYMKKFLINEHLGSIEELLKHNKSIFLTLGKKGMFFCDKKESFHLDSINVKPKDIVGAGDSFMAGLTLALSSGANSFEASEIATLCSAITITKNKTGEATQKEIFQFHKKYLSNNSRP